MSKRIGRIVAVLVACLLAMVLIGLVLGLVACQREPVQTQIQSNWLDRVYAKSFTFQSAVVTNTNGTAMTVKGYPTIGLQVTGITTATVTWQGTIDGSTWVSVLATNFTSGSAAATTTADGVFYANVKGLDQVRAVVSGWVSGTITVSGLAVTH